MCDQLTGGIGHLTPLQLLGLSVAIAAGGVISFFSYRLSERLEVFAIS